MASTVIKNWDNKTWLSSNDYIRSFHKFLFKNIKLNPNSEILDIGCGRGKILGTIKSSLKLKSKPTGIDIINHKDKDKRINFKKSDATSFFLTSKKKFDLIYAAEAAIGLAIIVVYYRNAGTIRVEEIDNLKG